LTEQQEFQKYQRALDVSMLIALGKLILFNKCWEHLMLRAKKKVRRKKLDSLKVALRERINNLPDKLFFIPPDRAASSESVKRYFHEKFEKDKLDEKIMAELRKRVLSAEPGLAQYLTFED
jgi:hypothetical protein